MIPSHDNRLLSSVATHDHKILSLLHRIYDDEKTRENQIKSKNESEINGVQRNFTRRQKMKKLRIVNLFLWIHSLVFNEKLCETSI
jgi:hypothetical protein